MTDPTADREWRQIRAHGRFVRDPASPPSPRPRCDPEPAMFQNAAAEKIASSRQRARDPQLPYAATRTRTAPRGPWRSWKRARTPGKSRTRGALPGPRPGSRGGSTRRTRPRPSGAGP